MALLHSIPASQALGILANHATLTMTILILTIMLLAALLTIAYISLKSKAKANKSMREEGKSRLDFFLKLAHEFRTPLTIIIGLSENIENGKAATNEDIIKAAQVIKRNGRLMQELTNQLLELSKINSNYNEVVWRRGDVVACTQMIVDSFMPLAAQRGISLQYTPAQKEACIAFVPDYHNKIFNNLIFNSLKYTNEGGRVDVSTSLEAEDFIIIVADTGIGISEARLPHIFNEFYTSNDNTTNVNTGIGLAMVKHIIDQLGGNIDVKSTVGKGTTFTISIPLREDDKHFPAYDIENKALEKADEEDLFIDDEQEDNSRTRILIVEDNTDVIAYLSSLLRTEYAIIYAKDGIDGLRKAKEQVPDLIVSDLMMPGMDGFQLCQTIRSTPLLAHIPFIIITAKVSEDDRILGLKAGADAYLAKPFNPDVLMVRISQLIAQRQQLRDRFTQAITNNESQSMKEQLSEMDRGFLNRIGDIVRQQMGSGSIDVESVAAKLCISSKQLRRKLYAITGETTVAFIMQIRLAEAYKQLIGQPQLTVSEIAIKCGFEDGGYFTKAFKQQYKITPTQLRKSTSQEGN